MRFNIAASVVLALTVAACGSRGSFSDSRVAPLQPQPVGPVSAQPLPPPPAETQPMETTMASAPAATPSAADAMEIRRPDMVGGWTIASGGENCQLFMSLTTWSGGYRANTRGCASDELKSVGAWDLSGKEIVLKDASGAPIARLFASAATRFSGQSSTGRGVQVFR